MQHRINVAQQCVRCPLKFHHYKDAALCDVCQSREDEKIRASRPPRQRRSFTPRSKPSQVVNRGTIKPSTWDKAEGLKRR